MSFKKTASMIVAALIVVSIATPASATMLTQRTEADPFGISAQITGNDADGKGWVNFYARVQNVPGFSYAIGDDGGLRSKVEFEWDWVGTYNEDTDSWSYGYSDSIIRVRADFDLDLQIVPNPIDNGYHNFGGGINQNIFGTEYSSNSWLNVEGDEFWADGYVSMTGWQLNNVYLDIETEERFRWGDWTYNEEIGEWIEGEITIENWLEISARAYGTIDLNAFAAINGEVVTNAFVQSLDVQFATVPEPMTMALLGLGGLLLRRRRG